ncbi:PREDICTED: uncharacterized protein LOC107188409 [Dufourea novaeangliae]|nr:PREDICTED: uncharacterized protein LOC107188409 [Dufourea novaeangliae]XP_015432184.1 PREDICTED: uncharacterized protein LOC107188409 [Dufourea novaeangliae]XP_015432185.1 PREDICTED: uncharacterized protein LOC107188409 [Dufourea novaeangliae]
MENMYLMKDTMDMESKILNPKRENMLHSVLNAFNHMWERFAKVPVSFLTGINYPLSVTVVNNGLISPEFFKDMTTKRDALGTDSVYIHNASMKESLNIIENIHHDIFGEKKLYVSRILNENAIGKLKYNYNSIGIDNKDTERSDKGKSIVEENFCDLLTTENLNEESIEDSFEHVCLDSTGNIENMHSCEYTNNDRFSSEEQFSDCFDNIAKDKLITDSEPLLCTTSSDIVSVEPNKQTVSDMLTNVWQKVYGSMTDRFSTTNLIDSDITMKRPLSPKQRRKVNTMAKGRGRGRARSQLRRSGVSQTRYRKERTKHDLAADIQMDFENWQDLDVYHTTESKESEDCFSLDEDVVDGLDITETISHATFTFADVEPIVQTPKMCKTYNQGMSKVPARMRCISECGEDRNMFDENCVENRYNLQRKTFRSRLISESSIDSEDSYCIVFETESEIYKSDLEDTDESDLDETSDDEETDNSTCYRVELVPPTQKVKFNLNPTVHIMVQWDYAYRAARKGPWEEMARDRERFKGRINCIERVLNPILTTQHRTHMWQERFANI